jgi:hypothetical protein
MFDVCGALLQGRARNRASLRVPSREVAGAIVTSGGSVDATRIPEYTDRMLQNGARPKEVESKIHTSEMRHSASSSGPAPGRRQQRSVQDQIHDLFRLRRFDLPSFDKDCVMHRSNERVNQ